MTDDTTTAARDLATRLEAAEATVRAAAAESLARLGDAAAAAAIPLVRACGDTDDVVRDHAVAALEDLGAPPADAIDALTLLVGHDDALVAYWAATLLGRSGPTAAAAVPMLARCLDSPADDSVRQRAAWALGKIGPAAATARESLARAAGQTDTRLARLADEALSAIGR